MEFLVLSDPHITWQTPEGRKDDILTTWKSKLSFVFDYALKYNQPILLAGDVFDTPRSWKTLSLILQFFNSYKSLPKIYAVYGQHDTYMYNEESRHSTSLGILAEMGYINMVNDKPILHGDVALYGSSYGQEIPVPVGKKWKNVLIIHKMIVDTLMWVDQQNAVSCQKFLKDNPEYDLIACGDAHQRFLFTIGDRAICNTGPLLRLEASKQMFNHKPALYSWNSETGKVTWIEIPHEPADSVLSRTHIEGKEQINTMLESFIGGMQRNEDVFDFNFLDNLTAYMDANAIEAEVRKVVANIIGRE